MTQDNSNSRNIPRNPFADLRKANTATTDNSKRTVRWLDTTAHARTDRPDEYLELDKYSKDYIESWAAKCCRSSFQSELKVRESDLLDEFGMKFVGAFLDSAEEAAARGKMLHPDYLSYLVLIVRNDVVHHNSHVSRRAYQCLLQYLNRYPYAAFVDSSNEFESESPSICESVGLVVVCPEAAWLPFFGEQGGFFQKSLMAEDMSMAGQEFGCEELDLNSSVNKSSQGKFSGEKWRYVDEMLLCFTERALESTEKDYNGDLLLLDYLVKVVVQDLDCRLQITSKILRQGVGLDDQSSPYVAQMKALLGNSALWRMLLEMNWNQRVMRQLVHRLVQMIVDVDGMDNGEMATQEEPEDDAPAGACAFSKATVSSLASTLLNAMLDLFGTMERIGGFQATSSNRAASANYRMALDEYLVESFWTERGFCEDAEDANTLLFSLRPRDALRLVGFVVADKFTKTFDEEYLRRNFSESVDGVHELFEAMHTISLGGKDVSKFFEIGVDAILESFLVDINRTIRMFKSADHLCLLVCALSSSLDKLLLENNCIPTGNKDASQIKSGIRKVIDAIYDNEAATNSASRVSNFGSMCLSISYGFASS
jgi:hypothetical protein